MSKITGSVGEALEVIHEAGIRFRDSYRAMLQALGACRLPSAVCMIYDEIPFLKVAQRAALAGFNEVIFA
jgi:hypothetical protein